MSISKVLLLLLFIGFQRSTAIPTTLASSRETHSTDEEPMENATPQTINEKKVKHLHHKDYLSSNYIQEQILLTQKMLHNSEEITKNQKDLSGDETVLVLGKAGSGKTSLVQFLTQNPKLQSKMVDTITGEYIIEDGEKIETSATESFTFYPEIVSYNSTTNFCDSPGFHRSPAHEIVIMNVMYPITNRFKKVKILLLENHSSLQYGVSKDSFIDTLRHLNDFVVDIDKYRDHIALIATKIPLTFRATDDIDIASGAVVTEIVTEEMHVESIVEFLNHTETSIEEKLKEKISIRDKNFYKKAIRLLQTLQTRGEDGKATRINDFRRPYKTGPLNNMPLHINNRESLLQTVNNLNFVEVRQNDFDYSLSNEAKMYLESMIELTSDYYKNRINELSIKLKEYVAHKTQNYTNFHQVLLDLVSFHDALKQFSENLDETKDYNEFFDKVNGFISDQKIPLQYNYNEIIHDLEKYEDMLIKFSDKNIVFTPSKWTLPIRQVIKSTEDELEWYQRLEKIMRSLSSYETQKTNSEIYYENIIHENSSFTNDLMMAFMNFIESQNLKQDTYAQAGAKNRSETELIVSSLLKDSSNITCDSNGRLTVKGFQLRLAEINSEDFLYHHCNYTTPKEIALLAVDTVFIDEDTHEIFKGMNMFIAAPNWKIIEQRKIDLSGQPGLEISGNLYVDNSKDGKPGLPGGNGGNFFGIGLHFSNGENLLIVSNGGEGGRGADGARGDRGIDGMNAEEKMKSRFYTANDTLKFSEGAEAVSLYGYFFSKSEYNQYNKDYKIPFYVGTVKGCKKKCKQDFEEFYSSSCVPDVYLVRTRIEIVKEVGDCGSDGSPGGLGGESGVGGLPGELKLIELSDSSHIKSENNTGSMGERGNKGQAGDRGKDGLGMICVHVVGYVEDSRDSTFWECESTSTLLAKCNQDNKLNQTVGYTTTGIKQPAPRKSTDFIHYLLDYAILLETHTNHTIYNKIITDFRKSIEKKILMTR